MHNRSVSEHPGRAIAPKDGAEGCVGVQMMICPNHKEPEGTLGPYARA